MASTRKPSTSCSRHSRRLSARPLLTTNLRSSTASRSGPAFPAKSTVVSSVSSGAASPSFPPCSLRTLVLFRLSIFVLQN